MITLLVLGWSMRGAPMGRASALGDDVSVFERLTERARMVVVLAQEEARILKHSYLGTPWRGATGAKESAEARARQS